MRGMTKKTAKDIGIPHSLPSFHQHGIHSNILNTFILKPLIQSLIFHIPMVSCHPRNRLLLPANVFDCPQILRKPKHFHLGFFRDKLGSKSWWFVWCSTGVHIKKWSQNYNYMFFRDGQRILGVISTMSVVHFFQMNFSYQPIKNRDEKPRHLSKALGIRPPTFGSRSEKDTIAILAEKFHRCGCFSAQSMGNTHACRRITRRPLSGTSHPGVQQDAADAKLIWEQDVCMTSAITGWHARWPWPYWVGLCFALTWHMKYIYIQIAGPQNQPSRALQFQLR